MSDHAPIVVTLPGGRQVDVHVGTHVIHTDQPRDNGGQDSGPSPFELFLGSIGACAGIFVQGFCATRNIPHERISIRERPQYNAEGVLTAVDLEVRVPPEFPDKYMSALINVVNQCTVKQAIKAQPEIRVQARRSE